jgi:hypothetical protein
MDLKEIEWKGIYWINVAQLMDKCLAVVSTLMTLKD